MATFKITRFKVIPTKDGLDCPIIEERILTVKKKSEVLKDGIS